MKKLFVSLLMICTALQVSAQIVQIPVMSMYDDNSVSQYIGAVREHANQVGPLFNAYRDVAYECWNKRDYSGFLVYSAKALDTGLWSTELYYDRGQAYEFLGYYKEAKDEYKYAYKNGYSSARYKISEMKEKIKEAKRKK
jgi:hypothetical protein